MDRIFTSNAEEIRYYVKELLEDGELHNREEIRNYVREHSQNGAGFSEGMFTGAIRDLVVNSQGLYTNPVRGKYQKTADESGKIAKRVREILEDTKQKIEQACVQNIMELDETDLKSAKTAAEFIKVVEKYIEKFS